MPQTVRFRTVSALVLVTAGIMAFLSQPLGFGINTRIFAGILIVAIFWTVIAGAGIWLAVEFIGVVNSRKIGIKDDAISVLRNRYARGEISRAEYFQMMQDLEIERD